MSPQCSFCAIPEIKERTITETAHSWAFPTNIPIVPGHILVSPKRCVATMSELSQEEFLDLWELVEKIKSALREVFHAEGFNIALNEGKLAGQSVPHVHVHVLPRKEGDTGITEYEPRKFLYHPGEREASPEEELRDIAEVVKKEIEKADV